MSVRIVVLRRRSDRQRAFWSIGDVASLWERRSTLNFLPPLRKSEQGSKHNIIEDCVLSDLVLVGRCHSRVSGSSDQ